MAFIVEVGKTLSLRELGWQESIKSGSVQPVAVVGTTNYRLAKPANKKTNNKKRARSALFLLFVFLLAIWKYSSMEVADLVRF